MFQVRRKQRLDHQDQEGEREDREAIPGAQAFSSPRKASQPSPRGSGESASSDPGSPLDKGSPSGPRAIASGAPSTTAELPMTSKTPHGAEAPLASRLHLAQYRDCGRPKSLVTNESTEFESEFEEEEEEEEEGESSSASTGLSHHPELKTTVSPFGRDGLCLSPHLEQSRPLLIQTLKRGSGLIGQITQIGRTSSSRRNRQQSMSTTVAPQEDALQAPCDGWLQSGAHRLGDLNVADRKTFSEPKEPAHVQESQAAESPKESSEEIPCRPKERSIEELAHDEEEEEEGDCCRICYSSDGSPTNPLTSPCLCSGSLRFIHLDCLKKWIAARIEMGTGPYTVKRCEICKGMLKPDPDALNMDIFYTEQLQRIIGNPELYPLMAERMRALRHLHRPNRFRRFVGRIRRWMTFGSRAS